MGEIPFRTDITCNAHACGNVRPAFFEFILEIFVLEKGTERLLKFQKLQQSTTEKLEKALNKEDISAFSRIMGTMVKVLGSMEKTDGE